ncbi:MAG TPA: DNA topoisomerase (ATP-hydrolyzing) subunit A [Oscillospiraceae bacterium]|nr:topoisomerase IV [Oscillospiraceae bacterium]HNW04709.1 DNA topoisomerase (ATP-hydrolyzing) subunit A [Oscillospiraceae bacterium]
MATRKKKEPEIPKNSIKAAPFENAGVVRDQPIVDALEVNYMPYAMSVIVSRAIPEIDGFKPSHRKLLYTMYKMGLQGGERTKSANIVGQTMKLNPHGDMAIYDTMVRMSKGYAALLHPWVDSKGNFGKAYSRNMVCAASRYTEARLDKISAELFRDIDKDTVDFVDNYDNTQKEPSLLPVTFPSVLVNFNVGIAVGMASQICPFRLSEVCETTIHLIKDPKHDLFSTLPAPDFAGGGTILFDRNELEKIYETGRGSIRVRSKYRYDEKNHTIEVTEIPATTTVEAIMDKIVELVKARKITEIADLRDETDLSGLKLAIDIKRGADPDALMQKLYRMTPLEDPFAANFNVLIAGAPRVLGVRELLLEWVAFREECVKRRAYFDLNGKKEKLHLLRGLEKILLNIDKAIRIIRETDSESEVVPNLMIGFGIDQIQADYVAEIKLRHLNREYLLKRTADIADLLGGIAELEGVLADPKKIDQIIVDELKEVVKKYGQPRRSEISYGSEGPEAPEEESVSDYPVTLFFTSEGYFKKITPQSLRMSGEQKLKEGDEILSVTESRNAVNLLFFSDRAQVYKACAADFDDTKASVMGDYIPAKLGFDDGENALRMAVLDEQAAYMLFFYQNGKAAKVPLSSYETKTRRKRLVGAYCDKSPLAACFCIGEDREFLLRSSAGRLLLVHSGAIPPKAARDTQGVAVMTLKKNVVLENVRAFEGAMLENAHRFRTRNLPAAGTLPKEGDTFQQIRLINEPISDQ